MDELNIELHRDDKNHTFPSRISVLALKGSPSRPSCSANRTAEALSSLLIGRAAGDEHSTKKMAVP